MKHIKGKIETFKKTEIQDTLQEYMRTVDRLEGEIEEVKMDNSEMLEELKRLNEWFVERLYVSSKPNTENLEYLIAKTEGKS
jgi:hypothetical protein